MGGPRKALTQIYADISMVDDIVNDFAHPDTTSEHHLRNVDVNVYRYRHVQTTSSIPFPSGCHPCPSCTHDMCICSLSDACCLLRVNADAMKVQMSYCLHMYDRCPYFIKRATREHKCCKRTMQREARLKTQNVAAERSRAMQAKKRSTPSEIYRRPP